MASGMLTREVIRRRAETYSRNYQAQPEEQKRARYKKASEAQQCYWKNLSPAAKKARTEKSRQHKKAMSAATRRAFGRKVSATKAAWSDERRALFIARNSEAQKRVWSALSEKDRVAWIRSANMGRRAYRFRRDDGVLVMAHSTWEEACYRTLRRLGVAFRYANEDGPAFKTGETHWLPDFVLKGRCLIIEVKGYGPSRRRFYTEQLPWFVQDHGDEYSVALCERKLDPKKCSSLQDVLNCLTFVHVAPKHLNRYGARIGNGAVTTG